MRRKASKSGGETGAMAVYFLAGAGGDSLRTAHAFSSTKAYTPVTNDHWRHISAQHI